MMNIRIVYYAVLFFSAVLLTSCAIRPTGQSTHKWALPCSDDEDCCTKSEPRDKKLRCIKIQPSEEEVCCIEGVKNFGKVSKDLWRGAQPTEDGFRNLFKEGRVKTVINLRADHDDYNVISKLADVISKPEEEPPQYIRIPMHAWKPDEAELALLMKVIDKLLKDPKRLPVFIHCQAGSDRTGYSIATYRMVIEGWPPHDAIQEMFDYGFHAYWFQNPTFLENLDLTKFNKRMSLTPW
jgi:tyrosine-protein phosphatase SIW14